ncbi:MAG: hypothetical protein EXQ95_03055, partial [Alphaproteobacteria bacterium]|nr:hypothetical protein [Alphaproteobacteria bacterium]
MSAQITLSDKRPPSPDADFAFEIDFVRGEGSASRVFAATHNFIKACERLDAELVRSIDSSIETVMVLEDIEAGSIRTWLRNSLAAVDDEGLKTLDWRPLVGKYLVRAKYAVLRWGDHPEEGRTLTALGKEIQQIAAETDVRHLPAYQPPSPQALIGAVRDFQEVKEHLLPGDRAKYIPRDEPPLEMNITVRINIADLEAMAVRETIELP